MHDNADYDKPQLSGVEEKVEESVKPRKQTNNWGQANYDWAMSLKGTMISREAEEETGIPRRTISRWWRGDGALHQRVFGSHKPASHCPKGHEMTATTVATGLVVSEMDSEAVYCSVSPIKGNMPKAA